MIVGPVNSYVYTIRVTIAAGVLIIYVSVYANRYLAIQNKHISIIGFKGGIIAANIRIGIELSYGLSKKLATMRISFALGRTVYLSC